METNEQKGEGQERRRRFLCETFKASMPLVIGWMAGRARGLAHVLQPEPTLRKTSPPPEVTSDLPPGVKQALDRQYEDFARDNPEHDHPEP